MLRRFSTAIRVASGLSTAVSSSAAIALQASPAQPLGLSLPLVLAAFAGAGLILSFLPHRSGGLVRLFGTIGFCTLLGAGGAPLVLKWQVLLAGFDLIAAFAIGAVAQILIPIAIDRGAGWLDRIIPGRNA